MSCEFQSFYFADDGYVVYCKNCGHYQVAFMCICLTLTKEDYAAFRKLVAMHHNQPDYSFSECCKNIIIKTPAEGISFILTKNETKRLNEILEEADTEEKTLALLHLFR